MPYCISTLTHTDQWDIEADTFLHYLKCKQRIVEWLRLEEVFGYVADCWCDMEATIHARTLRSKEASANSFMLRALRFDDRAAADRLMLGYLSASRMYLEHMKKRVKIVVDDDPEVCCATEALRNKFRSKDIYFLIADELRNRVTHEALGVEVVSYGFSLLEKPTSQATVHSTLSLPMKDLSALIDHLKKELAKQKKKKDANSPRALRLGGEIAALEAVKVPCELRAVMRHSFAALAEMHEELRSLVRKAVDEAIGDFEVAYEHDGHEAQGERGVFLCELASDGSCISCQWLGSAAVERLKYLRDKYSGWERVRDHVHGSPA